MREGLPGNNRPTPHIFDLVRARIKHGNEPQSNTSGAEIEAILLEPTRIIGKEHSSWREPGRNITLWGPTAQRRSGRCPNGRTIGTSKSKKTTALYIGPTGHVVKVQSVLYPPQNQDIETMEISLTENFQIRPPIPHLTVRIALMKRGNRTVLLEKTY